MNPLVAMLVFVCLLFVLAGITSWLDAPIEEELNEEEEWDEKYK